MHRLELILRYLRLCKMMKYATQNTLVVQNRKSGDVSRGGVGGNYDDTLRIFQVSQLVISR